MGPPQLGQSGKVMVGVRGHDASTTRPGQRRQVRRHHHASRLGTAQLGLVFGVAKETQVFGAGRPERGQAVDAGLGVAM
jgi:hypothetical protein